MAVSRTRRGTSPTIYRYPAKARIAMLDTISKLRPPAPFPQVSSLGPLALMRVLASNPLKARFRHA
jgi:hypothetical protein